MAIVQQLRCRHWKSSEASPSGYTNGKVTQRSPRARWSDYIFDLVLSWRGASRTTWDYCWPWGISTLLRAAVSAIIPRGKAGMNENECMTSMNVVCPAVSNFVIHKSWFHLRQLGFVRPKSRSDLKNSVTVNKSKFPTSGALNYCTFEWVNTDWVKRVVCFF